MTFSLNINIFAAWNGFFSGDLITNWTCKLWAIQNVFLYLEGKRQPLDFQDI